MSKLFKARNGINTNWFYGIPSPITDEYKGILNVFFETGILNFVIFPFCIWHCGTVGDINGSRTPFANKGEYKWVKPNKYAEFGALLYVGDGWPNISSM